MNILIKESLESINTNEIIPKILPHQLATIDFIFKKIFRSKESVLLFHKMGSGKTVIAIITAFFLTKEKIPVYIILLNSNVKLLWISVMNQIKSLLPFNEYNTHLLNIITKKQFTDMYESIEKNTKKVKFMFGNTVIMIDEAHNFFGNIASINLTNLNNQFESDINKPKYLLITGTPITNTILTLKDLISIITKPIDKHEIIKQDGRKIYNLNLTSDGKEIIKNLLNNKISYYNKIDSKLPKVYYKGTPVINFPIIPCIMSEKQTQNYYQIKENVSNEMFLKYLKDVSFTAMGNIENIYNFETYIKNKKQYMFTNTLYLYKGKFFGKELKTLENSCKLKYFVEQKIQSLKNRCKVFIYFSNSRIGGRFLKDVLKEWGIQEYGQAQLDNFLCYYCNDKRTCKTCKPMKYIIITSIYLTQINNSDDAMINNINNLLDIYNLPNNNNGEEIIFLFGSKIISESYTLKETREIWFLTIPDSITEITQIIARCLRTFSYNNVSIPVYIYILLSLTNDFEYKKIIKSHKSLYVSKKKSNYEKINSYINQLNLENNDYPYDFKKILYLEIKSKQTSEIYNIFKNCSPIYKETIDTKITELYILEMLRRFAFEHDRFTLDEFTKIFSKDLLNDEQDKNIIEKCLNKFVKDGVIIKNKTFNQSFVIKGDTDYYCSTILLNYKPYITKIQL